MAVTDSRELVVEATPGEIMEVLFDLESWPEWSSIHKEVEILERDDDGHPVRARQVVKVVGIGDEQELNYTVYDDGLGWDLVSSKAQRGQTGRYTLTPDPKSPDSTRMHFELTVDLMIPLPGFLVKTGTRSVMDNLTKGLRKRVLEGKKHGN